MFIPDQKILVKNVAKVLINLEEKFLGLEKIRKREEIRGSMPITQCSFEKFSKYHKVNISVIARYR